MLKTEDVKVIVRNALLEACKENIKVSHIDISKILKSSVNVHLSSIVNALYDIAIEDGHEIISIDRQDSKLVGVTILAELYNSIDTKYLAQLYYIVEDELITKGGASSDIVLKRMDEFPEKNESLVATLMVSYAKHHRLDFTYDDNNKRFRYSRCYVSNYRLI